MTGLAERRDVPVSRLSGGQRKRVSIAVELITKPSVIFLGRADFGTRPGAEERIMKLFRQIAESGRTVILTTHAMENVKLFDKIVVLMGGKLVFYGKPDEALKHFGPRALRSFTTARRAGIETAFGNTARPPAADHRADCRGMEEEVCSDAAVSRKRLKAAERARCGRPAGETKEAGGSGLFGAIRQWITLSRRYLEVLLRDKLTLLILFAQAPMIALMTYFVMGADQPRDFVYFVLALVAVWFGTSVSAREIIRERPVYNRERMVNLGLLPYLASKLFVLGIIVLLQCLMLFVPLKFFDLAGLMPMPGELSGIPQLWAMLLTAGVGIAVGLLVSALVRTSEMATSLVPLILIPQILFSGLVGVPSGISQGGQHDNAGGMVVRHDEAVFNAGHSRTGRGERRTGRQKDWACTNTWRRRTKRSSRRRKRTLRITKAANRVQISGRWIARYREPRRHVFDKEGAGRPERLRYVPAPVDERCFKSDRINANVWNAGRLRR